MCSYVCTIHTNTNEYSKLLYSFVEDFLYYLFIYSCSYYCTLECAYAYILIMLYICCMGFLIIFLASVSHFKIVIVFTAHQRHNNTPTINSTLWDDHGYVEWIYFPCVCCPQFLFHFLSISFSLSFSVCLLIYPFPVSPSTIPSNLFALWYNIFIWTSIYNPVR